MPKHTLLEEAVTGTTIRCFFEVYNTLGSGFPEHVYVLALHRELTRCGRVAACEVSVPVHYKGAPLTTLRIDLLVDGCVVVEAKSTEVLHPTAMRQLYNYLRATGIEVGLLLHFGLNPKFYRTVCPVRRRARASDPTHPMHPGHRR